MLERLLTPISAAVLNQIAKERAGEQTEIDASLLAKVIECFVSLSNERIVTEGVNPLNDLEAKIVESSK